jgi:hypothetical protein
MEKWPGEFPATFHMQYIYEYLSIPSTPEMWLRSFSISKDAVAETLEETWKRTVFEEAGKCAKTINTFRNVKLKNQRRNMGD